MEFYLFTVTQMIPIYWKQQQPKRILFRVNRGGNADSVMNHSMQVKN